MSNYRHPREIEDFDRLTTDTEPTFRKAKSGISLLEDSDAPRDWRLERRFGFGPHLLTFTMSYRESPSAMTTEHFDYCLTYRHDEDGGVWIIEGPGGFHESLSRDVVDLLVPDKFSDWLREQERADLPFWLRAA